MDINIKRCLYYEWGSRTHAEVLLMDIRPAMNGYWKLITVPFLTLNYLNETIHPA